MVIIQNVGQYLLDNGIKPSIQRIKIFDFLMKNHEHPTVDKIFLSLSDEIPTLSKTTVYNTLKLFQSQGIVNIVNIEDHETRYDCDTSFHGHFKCLECKNLYDFELENTELNINKFEGFKITESHYYLKGLCKSCLSNKI